MDRSGPVPQYQKVKQEVVRQIETGVWKPGDQIPSENRLVKEIGVSRMTVNRALRELSAEGLIIRVQGIGTYVAERRPPAELLELKNIADQIREDGKRHSQRLELLETVEADEQVARDMQIEPGTPVFHSILVHNADRTPVQIENRFVNRDVVSDYLDIDFDKTTPNEHLIRVAPLSEVEHIVEAVLAETWEQKILEIGPGEPCLQLRRRTWTGNSVASVARLIHPGKTHCFGTKFAFLPDGRANRSPIR